MRVVVDLGVLEEDAKLPVKATLDVLAVLEEGARLALEFAELFFAVYVAFETLHGRDPGRFADEGGDVLDLFANGWEDLNAR
jgi:hypothetical protein